MFDLAKDPKEMKNVYDNPQYAENVNKLKKVLESLQTKYDDSDFNYPELQGGARKILVISSIAPLAFFG